MSELLLTRLPVYAGDLSVFAYFLSVDYPESRPEAPYDVENAHLLISALTRPDIQAVDDGKPFFIALSKHLLSSDYLDLLPKDKFFITLPEHELDDAAIDTLTAYSQKGYSFGISHYRYTVATRRVLFAVKHVFVEAKEDDATFRKVVAEAKRFNIQVIATGVDDHASAKRLHALKVNGLMGDFLTKPDLFNPIPVSSNRLIVFKLLEALQDPDVNFDVLENLLSQDNRLSYKLLKVLNSPGYVSVGRKVTSVRDIIVIMGLAQLKSWATLLALTNIEDKPYELMVTTMLRARMAQGMAEALGVETPEMAFMAGLLSSLDALLDRTMADILAELPVSAPVKEALLHYEGPLGKILSDVIHYERGQWEALSDGLLARNDYRRLYTESVIWASKLCTTLSS